MASIEHVIETGLLHYEGRLNPLFVFPVVQALSSVSIHPYDFPSPLPWPISQTLPYPVIEYSPYRRFADTSPQVPGAIGTLENMMVHTFLSGLANGTWIILEVSRYREQPGIGTYEPKVTVKYRAKH